MDYQQALERWEAGQGGQYILFCGEEEYLIAQGVRRALEALRISVPELNVSVFETLRISVPELGASVLETLEELPEQEAEAGVMEALINAMGTLPFMSDRRAVVVKSTEILSADCPAEYSEKLAGALLPPGNYLILGAKGKVDKRRKFVKRIEREGLLADCAPLNGDQLSAFARRRAEEKGLILSPANAAHLCEMCDDLQTLENEIEKLSGVCRGHITRDEIDLYAAKSLQYNMFRVHDLLCARNAEAAKSVLDRVLEGDKRPIGLISFIAGNFRQMLVARACRDAGFPERKTVSHIMAETGAADWMAKRAVQNCKSFTAAELRVGIKKLGRMDFDAKQGGMEPETDLFPLLAALYLRASR